MMKMTIQKHQCYLQVVWPETVNISFFCLGQDLNIEPDTCKKKNFNTKNLIYDGSAKYLGYGDQIHEFLTLIFITASTTTTMTLINTFRIESTYIPDFSNQF